MKKASSKNPHSSKKLNNSHNQLSKLEFDKMMRVDHAGEFGARRIYAGQLAILGKDPETRKLLEHMKEQEEIHFQEFDQILKENRIRPTALLPVWNVAGYLLGAGTALLGKRAAMACTVAVEEAIEDHYNEQLEKISDPELHAKIQKFRDEELKHRDIGLENEAEKTFGYNLIYAGIRKASKLAIFISERV